MAKNLAPIPVGTSRDADRRAYHMRTVTIPAATQQALEALKEFGNHTFVPMVGKPHPRVAPEAIREVLPLMSRLFERSGTTLTGVVLSDDEEDANYVVSELRALYVLICELHGVTGTYGQRTVWYNEMLNDERVSRELKRRRGFRRNR